MVLLSRVVQIAVILISSYSIAAPKKSAPKQSQGFINDSVGFFSKDTVKRANEMIREMKKVHRKEILIETVHKIPMRNENAVMEGKEIDPLFSDWAKKRLSKTGTKNVYIVISKSPSFIMAAVGSETRSKGEFTESDRNILIKLLAENFQRKEHDKALLDSVGFVRTAIEANLKGTPIVVKAPEAQRDPNSDVTFLWRWIGFGCAALLGLLLITGLIRGLGKTPAGPIQENTPA